MKKKTLLFVTIFPLAAVLAYAAIGISLFLNQNQASAVDNVADEIVYTVTFDTGEGSAAESVRVAAGLTIEEPVTTRAGYKFLGWYLNLDDAKSFDFTTEIQSDLTLHAKWVEVYTVTYETCGGVVLNPTRVTKGQIIAAPIPVRDDYEFLGWYTDAAYRQKADFTVAIQSDVVVYAKWARSYVNNYQFVLADDGLSYGVVGYNGDSTELVIIPRTYQGLPVTFIASLAFSENEKLTEIIIPASITTIDRFAFIECPALTKIDCEAAAALPDWRKHWNYCPDADVVWECNFHN